MLRTERFLAEVRESCIYRRPLLIERYKSLLTQDDTNPLHSLCLNIYSIDHGCFDRLYAEKILEDRLSSTSGTKSLLPEPFNELTIEDVKELNRKTVSPDRLNEHKRHVIELYLNQFKEDWFSTIVKKKSLEIIDVVSEAAYVKSHLGLLSQMEDRIIYENDVFLIKLNPSIKNIKLKRLESCYKISYYISLYFKESEDIIEITKWNKIRGMLSILNLSNEIVFDTYDRMDIRDSVINIYCLEIVLSEFVNWLIPTVKEVIG